MVSVSSGGGESGISLSDVLEIIYRLWQLKEATKTLKHKNTQKKYYLSFENLKN